GFLRSEVSLMQTAGRAARNVSGEVIMYADQVTDSMKRMISETNRRRRIQFDYNEKHGITPETISKTREEILQATQFADSKPIEEERLILPDFFSELTTQDKISFLLQQMKQAADNLEFEQAAELRDQIKLLKAQAKKRRSRR
ncbi:MAG: UvrB/UvrC motif-containing protein, partial [candidate division Zixibacteria bacterium]|nr:UvrB/UvrC motif-containing protein [candidate division Zixibacteria bacterium]